MTVERLLLDASFLLLAAAVMLTLLRFLRGPSVPDRVVSLDLLTTIGIGIIAAVSVQASDPVFLDVALTLALIAFLGTVGFAYYLDRGGPTT